MTLDEWQEPYRALCRTWNKTPNPQQAEAYFEVLKSYTLAVIEQAIVRANAEAPYFPQPSKIKEHAHGIIAGAVYTPAECSMCGGNLFVPTDDQVHFTRTYHYVKGCPRCKVTEVA